MQRRDQCKSSGRAAEPNIGLPANLISGRAALAASALKFRGRTQISTAPVCAEAGNRGGFAEDPGRRRRGRQRSYREDAAAYAVYPECLTNPLAYNLTRGVRFSPNRNAWPRRQARRLNATSAEGAQKSISKRADTMLMAVGNSRLCFWRSEADRGANGLFHVAFEVDSMSELARLRDALDREGRRLAWGPGAAAPACRDLSHGSDRVQCHLGQDAP